jgi:hypothetical protein
MQRIVLYTKPGCHLCEEALDLLLDLCAAVQMHAVVEEVNILDDPVLYERFRHAIPVIAIDPEAAGPTLCAPITAPTLRQALGLNG